MFHASVHLFSPISHAPSPRTQLNQPPAGDDDWAAPLRKDENVVFIHTGGSVGLFGYREAFAP